MGVACSVMFTIFIWCAPHNLLELSVKIGQVAVTAAKGNLRYHLVGGGEGITCRIDPQLCQMLHGAYTNGFLKASHKIAFT